MTTRVDRGLPGGHAFPPSEGWVCCMSSKQAPGCVLFHRKEKKGRVLCAGLLLYGRPEAVSSFGVGEPSRCWRESSSSVP